MKRYRIKPEVVKAEQWHPEAKIPIVQVEPVRICYSLMSDYFYVYKAGFRSDFWMSVETFTERPKVASLEDGAIIVNKGVKLQDQYYRKLRSFGLWDIKPGKTEVISEDDDRYKDYASIHAWPDIPPTIGYIQVSDDRRIFVNTGDWILFDEKGNFLKTVVNSRFNELYEPEPTALDNLKRIWNEVRR